MRWPVLLQIVGALFLVVAGSLIAPWLGAAVAGVALIVAGVLAELEVANGTRPPDPPT